MTPADHHVADAVMCAPHADAGRPAAPFTYARSAADPDVRFAARADVGLIDGGAMIWTR